MLNILYVKNLHICLRLLIGFKEFCMILLCNSIIVYTVHNNPVQNSTENYYHRVIHQRLIIG